MGTNPDFRDLFSAFNAASCRYLVVGAYAVVHYGEPRYTKDLDIWVEPVADNARCVLAALKSFGAPVALLTIEDLCNPELVYQIGVEPNRIDVLMGIDGVEWGEAWAAASEAKYGDDVPIRVIGLDHLIRAKQASGRLQDQLDIEILKQVKRRR